MVASEMSPLDAAKSPSPGLFSSNARLSILGVMAATHSLFRWSASLAVLAILVGCGDDFEPNAARDAAQSSNAGDAPVGGVDAGLSADAWSLDAWDGVSMDPGADCLPDPPVSTVIVLPDTQMYVYYPEIFRAQMDWIVEETKSRRIDAVLHVGDVVDDPLDRAQWTVASTALRVMDGVVPYVLVPGNHDTDPARATLMNEFFAPASMPWIMGTWMVGQMENNYTLMDIGPQRWLILGLEFGPRHAVVSWADSILKAYAELPAILIAHAYLYDDGTRYDWSAKGAQQDFNPHWYAYTPEAGINDGEELWRKLVLPNDNVRLVLCGHVPSLKTAHLTSIRPNGTRVHQILSDYQGWENGGNGYLRVMDFDYRQKAIRVQTYSPFLNRFEVEAGHSFTISLDI